MKKNYTCPVVEVNAFDFEDVVMVSSYNVSLEAKTTDAAAYNVAVSKLKKAAGETKVVVEW